MAEGKVIARFAVLAVIGAAMIVSWPSAAGQNPNSPAASPRVSIGADQIIAGRRAAFVLSASAYANLKASVDRGESGQQIMLPAIALARWSKALPGMFPDGTQTGKTRALPAVWDDRGDFEEKARSYGESALRLAQYAQAGDLAALSTELTVTQKICASCHQRFRQPDPTPPPTPK